MTGMHGEPVLARPEAAFYGAPIGILLLDCVAPFIPGSVGNASTYRMPVRYKTVPGCTVERLIEAPDDAVSVEMVRCARELHAEGARLIAGNCGFMIRHQSAVQAAVGASVALSSLLLAPLLCATLPAGHALGVITASRRSLTPQLLTHAGVRDQAPLVIAGLDECPTFSAAFMECTGRLDPGQVERETVGVATDMVQCHPEVATILLECSELPPYAAAVQKATARPVFDFISMIELFAGALVRREFAGTY